MEDSEKIIPPTEGESPVEEVKPEPTFPHDPQPEKSMSAEDIDRLVNEKVDLILGKVVDKLNEKHTREMEALKKQLSNLDDKLPKTITPRKVEGYYDFNSRTNEFLNESAKNDYTKAKDTLDYVRTIFK